MFVSSDKEAEDFKKKDVPAQNKDETKGNMKSFCLNPGQAKSIL